MVSPLSQMGSAISLSLSLCAFSVSIYTLSNFLSLSVSPPFLIPLTIVLQNHFYFSLSVSIPGRFSGSNTISKQEKIDARSIFNFLFAVHFLQNFQTKKLLLNP